VSGADATQAVILAGGQGTRLRPLTLARAKSVVPLSNRPFLAFQAFNYAAAREYQESFRIGVVVHIRAVSWNKIKHPGSKIPAAE